MTLPDLLQKDPRLGIREDGTPWYQPLRGTHVLITGPTGSGKTTALLALVKGLLPAVANGRCRLWLLDPKHGMELGFLRPIAYRFATSTNFIEVLADAVSEMEQQEFSRDGILNVVVLDGISDCASMSGDRETFGSLLVRLLEHGGKAGFSVIGTEHDPRIRSVSRQLYPWQISFGADPVGTGRVTLDGGMPTKVRVPLR